MYGSGTRLLYGAPRPLEIDNALTAEEIADTRSRVDGKARRVAAFARRQTARLPVTYYNLGENRGVTALYLRDMASGEVRQLTDHTSNNTSPAWSADGRTLYFLSDRSGTQQVWRMAAAGGEPQQVTAFDADVEGFGVNKPGDAIWYVQTVAVPGAEKCSADLYKDMPRSKAHIYDDLMARHWNYWDEGRYRHLFIAALTDGKAAEGVDHRRRRRGVGRTHGALLRHGRDRMEQRRRPAGLHLQAPRRHRLRPFDRFGHLRLRPRERPHGQHLQADGGPRPLQRHGTPQYALPGYDKYPVWSPDDRYIAFRSMATPGYEADKERLMRYDCRTAEITDLTPSF